LAPVHVQFHAQFLHRVADATGKGPRIKEQSLKRIYKLKMFIECDDKNLDKLMAAAKKIVRAANPDIPEDELVDCPGSAVETVISDRMMCGRPPLDCVQSEGDMYGVPAPDNWNDPKSDVVDLRDYCARFLREHPPIVDEDDFPTGEFEGYPVKVK
jgi:hypothetical protein